ncbi:MAG: hypothetical protein Q9216_006860 [Gyalolechia sp. 2 TL-2023]
MSGLEKAEIIGFQGVIKRLEPSHPGAEDRNESEEQEAGKVQREAQQLAAHTWTTSSLERTKNMYRRQKEWSFPEMLRRAPARFLYSIKSNYVPVTAAQRIEGV